MLRRMPYLALVPLLLGAGTAPAQEKVDVRPVKYADMGKEVFKHRGKVVLVDFWHTY
jgi:hypothetical protein